MLPDFSELIPLASLVIAGLALYRNVQLDTKHNSGELTTVIVKLESIGANVNEIKNEVRDVKGEINKMKERLVIAEQSLRSAHKRIDELNETEN